jgi:DNA-binding GntR family transcriptional regulator
MHLGLALTTAAEDCLHDHRDLLDAILAGDAAAARDIAVSQAQRSHRMVVDGLLNSEPILSTNLVVGAQAQLALVP